MTQAKNSTQVLQAAEWIIDNIGWAQFANFLDKDGQIIGSAFNRKLSENLHPLVGSVCLTGAIDLVEANWSLKDEALDRLAKIAGMSPMEFNDRPGRTKQEVIDLIRKAIGEK